MVEESDNMMIPCSVSHKKQTSTLIRVHLFYLTMADLAVYISVPDLVIQHAIKHMIADLIGVHHAGVGV